MKDLAADPFGEQGPELLRRRLRLLGGDFVFESGSPALLRLVDWAFAGLPRYRLASRSPRFRVRLVLNPRRPRYRGKEPPAVTMNSGGGFLQASMDEDNFAILSPRERSALVVVSSDMLRFDYHLRYELIEFTVLTLAARAQGLVSLHAGCVGQRGRGVLLVGASGAGKSTLCMQALADGLDFLAEDSVFVEPGSLRAAAVPNFLHVRQESLRHLPSRGLAAAIRRAPRIRRRSGVRKYALDLRKRSESVAPRALELAAVVFLSKRRVRDDRLWAPMATDEAVRTLRKSQAYAANQQGWKQFERSIGHLPVFQLHRGSHPARGVASLRELLDEVRR